MDRRNHIIDVLKFIFSLCIIGVHVHLFEDVNIRAYKLLTQSLFRIGVPFYLRAKRTPSIGAFGYHRMDI